MYKTIYIQYAKVWREIHEFMEEDSVFKRELNSRCQCVKDSEIVNLGNVFLYTK